MNGWNYSTKVSTIFEAKSGDSHIAGDDAQ